MGPDCESPAPAHATRPRSALATGASSVGRGSPRLSAATPPLDPRLPPSTPARQRPPAHPFEPPHADLPHRPLLGRTRALAHPTAVHRLLFLATLLLALSGCESLFFYPQRTLRPNPHLAKVAHTEVELTTPDGLRLHGWRLAPPATPPRATILFFHGNAENISTHVNGVLWLALAGYQVVLFDYRGYGQSEGKPTLDRGLPLPPPRGRVHRGAGHRRRLARPPHRRLDSPAGGARPHLSGGRPRPARHPYAWPVVPPLPPPRPHCRGFGPHRWRRYLHRARPRLAAVLLKITRPPPPPRSAPRRCGGLVPLTTGGRGRAGRRAGWRRRFAVTRSRSRGLGVGRGDNPPWRRRFAVTRSTAPRRYGVVPRGRGGVAVWERWRFQLSMRLSAFT